MQLVRRWALIPAAGVGMRMGSNTPKQYLKLQGHTVLELTLQRFLTHPRVDGVVVVLRPDDEHWAAAGLDRLVSADSIAHLREGEMRSDSVRAGLELLGQRCAAQDWILVHDAVRPCVRGCDVDRLIDTVGDDAVGGLLGVPVRDTMKRVVTRSVEQAQPRVETTVERSGLWHALTPQMFRFELLVRALDEAARAGCAVTDEASAVERLGSRPMMVEGRIDNIKITRPEDLALARLFLSAEQEGALVSQQRPNAQRAEQEMDDSGKSDAR